MRTSTATDFRRLLRGFVNSLPNQSRPSAARVTREVLAAGVGSVEELEALARATTSASDVVIPVFWLLGALKTAGAEDALLTALRQGDPVVRTHAAISLAGLRSTAAVPDLLDLLTWSEEANLRRIAVYALGQIGDRRAIQPILNILGSDDEAAEIRGEAAEALANLGAHEAVPELLRCLSNESAEVRFWAIHALGWLGTAAVLPELRMAVEHDRETIERWGSIEAEAREAIRMIEWNEAHR